jgi:hypothetical protein
LAKAILFLLPARHRHLSQEKEKKKSRKFSIGKVFCQTIWKDPFAFHHQARLGVSNVLLMFLLLGSWLSALLEKND